MLQKIFNTILTLVFIVLVVLYAYKTMNESPIMTSNVTKTNTIATPGKKDNTGAMDHSWSKAELHAAIKDYIINNPEDIMASLEGMQQRKVQDSAKQAFNYLAENQNVIEQVDSPPALGNPGGDISIVVFYDYNCSFCKKANEHTNEIVAMDPGVKVILRPIPILGGTSTFAAKIALAIQKISPEKFPAIHDAIMNMKPINEESVKALVEKHDIDYSLVDNEVNSFAIKQWINKNFELAKGLGIQGAPSYVINGNFLPGLLSVEKFRTIIAEIRESSGATTESNENEEQSDGQ